MSNLENLLERLRKFRDERDWRKYHKLKNLAISISIEAAELLEHFQWVDEIELEKKREEIEEEVADVFIYLLFFCDVAGIDLIKATEKKMNKNELKYPAKKDWKF